MNEIEEFIKRRFSNDCNWLYGNCYYFALILCYRFPYLEKIYYPIEGHWVVSDGEYAYDFNGKSKMVYPLWKTVWQFLKKLNVNLPYDPALPLLGIYPREIKTYVHTETYILMFIETLFLNCTRKKRKWKQS